MYTMSRYHKTVPPELVNAVFQVIRITTTNLPEVKAPVMANYGYDNMTIPYYFIQLWIEGKDEPIEFYTGAGITTGEQLSKHYFYTLAELLRLHDLSFAVAMDLPF